MPELDLPAHLQAIMFVATEPLSVKRLAEITESTPEATTEALSALESALENTGLRLSVLDDQYRLVTAPDAAATIRRFLQSETSSELSRPALETLAIVAYRGPITKSGIESIRGVSSDTMIRNLLSRGLIAESGKSNEPGRPTLYAISHTFMQHFGLTSQQDLPPLPEAPKP